MVSRFKTTANKIARATLVSCLRSSLLNRGRRGARPARREEGAYRVYVTDEQRRRAGCIGGRMPTNFGDTTLMLHRRVMGSPTLMTAPLTKGCRFIHQTC